MLNFHSVYTFRNKRSCQAYISEYKNKRKKTKAKNIIHLNVNKCPVDLEYKKLIIIKSILPININWVLKYFIISSHSYNRSYKLKFGMSEFSKVYTQAHFYHTRVLYEFVL